MPVEIEFGKVGVWGIAKAKLDYWKAEEERLRREICEELFQGRVGVFKSSCEVEGPEYSIRLKAKSVVNVKVDEVILTQLSNDGKLTTADNECFERKLKIMTGSLNKIPGDSAVWGAITKTPGMPKLEVVKIDDET